MTTATNPFLLAADAFTPRERTLADEQFPTPGALAAALDPEHNLNPPHLQLLDEQLVAAARNELDRLLITMPPQEGKSTRCCHYFALWLLKNNPDLRIGIVSMETEKAARWGRAIRDSIADHDLGIRVREDVKAAGRWKILGHRGSVFCAGWQGSITGEPIDVLIIDDPVKDAKAADSPTYREDLWDWWISTGRARLGPASTVVAIMTRWHPDDIGGRWITEEGRVENGGRWTVLNIPAQAEEHDLIGRDAGGWLPSARGRTVEQWEQLKSETPDRWWSAQYQGRPTPPEGAVWQRSWIDDHRIPKERLPQLLFKAVSVDPAGSSNGAEAGIIGGGLGADSDVYVLADYSIHGSAADRARRVCECAIDIQADVILVEEDFGGDNIEELIRSVWRQFVREGAGGRRVFKVPRIESVRAAGQGSKRTRAEVAAGFSKQGRVHHVDELPGLEEQQLGWSGDGPSPDRIDALSHLVRELLTAEVRAASPSRGARLAGRR
jgi:hypothetical protein